MSPVQVCGREKLRVLKVELRNHSESFFHALSDNQSLRELSIETTGKIAILLFQTLPSTFITTLNLSQYSKSEGLIGNEGSLAFKEYIHGSKVLTGNEGSLAFKEYIHGSKVLTGLRVYSFVLTDEGFKGIIFTKDSTLRELSLTSISTTLKKGWTELFNDLCSSYACITTLDISENILDGEECCTALKCLLINNKTLTALKIGYYINTNHDLVCCIADALSQNCSLMELTISYTLSTLACTQLQKKLT